MRFLILMLAIFSIRSEAQPLATAYTENAYQQGEKNASSKIKVQLEQSITSSLSPFLQAGQELAISTQSIGPRIEDGSSFIYVSPGLQWRFGGFSLSGEVRMRRFYGETSPQPTADARALLIYGNFLSSKLTGPLSSFLEIYSESVLSSADSWNLILTNFVRAGVRASASESVHLDAFLEPSVSVDRMGHYYYNKVVARPSLRLQYAKGNFAVGIIGAYSISHSFTQIDSEPNPYPNPLRGVRGLAFLSAAL